jgi:hypothetical protein
MSEKPNIKVIKRADAPRKTKKAPVGQTSRQAAREMVSTVGEWVTELKEKKAEETREAMDLLFSGPAPSES